MPPKIADRMRVRVNYKLLMGALDHFHRVVFYILYIVILSWTFDERY